MDFFSNWAKNLIFLIVYILSGVTLVVIIDGLLTGDDLTPFNTALESAMAALRTPPLTTFLVMVTNIGSPFILAIAACILAGALILGKDAYNAYLFLVSMALSIISFIVLKNAFEVARPSIEILQITGWSFPSGHATVATAFFFALSHAFFGRIPSDLGKIVLIVGSIIAAGLVCFSRIYLGAHWGLDILGGVALGVLSVSFTVLMFNVFLEERTWRNRRRSVLR